MKKLTVIIVMTALCFGFIGAALANDPGTKLSRGVTNSLTGLLEVPLTIGEEWKASKNMAVGIFVGGAKGLVWGFMRTCSGLYDLLTFPIPLPEKYDSLIKPDYVWRTTPAHLIIDEPAAAGTPTVPNATK